MLTIHLNTIARKYKGIFKILSLISLQMRVLKSEFLRTSQGFNLTSRPFREWQPGACQVPSSLHTRAQSRMGLKGPSEEKAPGARSLGPTQLPAPLDRRWQLGSKEKREPPWATADLLPYPAQPEKEN